ncbi:MAG TPA: hypothetical protein VJ927_09920 [Actinomycetota bacterium]|nr:hypothetical protein [Actinomycetota bacterium]
MSPSLKAFLALVFVVVVGAILIQPILSAVDSEPVAVEPTPEPAPSEPEETDTPEPSLESTPTPSLTEDESAFITGPFRTEPLADRYPRSCLRPTGEGVGTEVAVRQQPRWVGRAPVQGGPVESAMGVGPFGFGADGEALAIQKKVRPFVFMDDRRVPLLRIPESPLWAWSPTSDCIAAVDVEGSLWVGPPGEEPEQLVREAVRDLAYSPDGRMLAVLLEQGKTTSLWIADLTRTRMREIYRVRTGPRVSLKGWSPDGFTIYLTVAPDSGLSFVGFTRTSAPPLSGGIVAAPVTGLEQCSGRLLGIVNGAIAEITRRGPEYLTPTDAGFTAVSCAPNGAFLAAVRNADLLLLNGDGSPIRDLTTDSGFRDVFVDWGPRGSGLLFGRVPDAGGDAQVWHIAEGGTARDTGLRYRPGPDAIDWAASPPTGLP